MALMALDKLSSGQTLSLNYMIQKKCVNFVAVKKCPMVAYVREKQSG